MNMKFFSVAMGVALSAMAMTASAQKSIQNGLITYSTNMRGNDIEIKEYFSPDSISSGFSAGPATIKLLTDANHKSFVVMVDVPMASIKKAAVYTPAEIEEVTNSFPKFTFAPGTETKQISGYNCKKVVATDAATKKTYDVWITNDITVPAAAIPSYYRSIGGFPVQYAAFQQGQSTDVTIKSVVDQVAPKGTFSIPSDFDKISKSDLEAMSGGGGN